MIIKVLKYIFAALLVLSCLLGVLAGAKFLRQGPEKLAKKTVEKPILSALPYTAIGTAVKATAGNQDSETSSQKFTVDLGATKSRETAEKILETLSEQGLQAYYTPVQRQNGSVAFRVRVGLYKTEDEASKSVEKIAKSTPYTGKILKI